MHKYHNLQEGSSNGRNKYATETSVPKNQKRLHISFRSTSCPTNCERSCRNAWKVANIFKKMSNWQSNALTRTQSHVKHIPTKNQTMHKNNKAPGAASSTKDWQWIWKSPKSPYVYTHLIKRGKRHLHVDCGSCREDEMASIAREIQNSKGQRKERRKKLYERLSDYPQIGLEIALISL